MKNNKWCLALLCTLVMACSEDKIEGEREVPDQQKWKTENPAHFVPGQIYIKLKPTGNAGVKLSSVGGTPQMGVSRIDRIAREIGAESIKRVFRPAGRFEARTHEAGLDRWYVITFPKDVPLTRAAGDLESVEEIDIVEPMRRVRRVGSAKPIPIRRLMAAKQAAAGLFDDPLAYHQWHYDNDGSLEKAEAGADINLQKAWQATAGSREVVVAIVDGGIDIDHEDLAANVWVNEDEQPGAQDHDKNGYDGDINGWNFVHDGPTIEAESHGTHVAGTVGAVNNNGVGVCGVAGGSGNGDGVRLMSCQIFAPVEGYPDSTDDATSSIPEAIKYGADNGAVISQNSWGYVYEEDEREYTSLDSLTEDAIDYFIQYAGMDENGNQVGPMKGGIVIFAAGNEGEDYLAQPASYEKVLSVASMAPDYRMAYYTNYADWVDITAPGGDMGSRFGKSEYGVASTIPDNKYAYMQGTSMACPHVSGVAALIVAKYGVGHPGFTPDDLRARLIGTARNDIYAYNPDYVGKLGAGLMDAGAAVQEDDHQAPDAVTDLAAEWLSNAVNLTWSVTADADNGTPDHYDVYVSETDLSQADLTTVEVTTRVNVKEAVGKPLSVRVEKLKSATAYYVAVVGVDMFGNRSDAAFLSGTTLVNQPPVVTPRSTDAIVLRAHETKKFYYDVADPEGQKLTVALKSAREGVAVVLEGGAATLTINAPKVSSGAAHSGEVVIVVTDDEENATEQPVPFTIEANHAPEATATVWENLYFERPGESKSVKLKDYFTDADGEKLTYEVTASVSGIVRTEVTDEQLVITSVGNGLGDYTVVATDRFGKQASRQFKLMSRDSRIAMDVYPNPVVDKLYIRMGKNVKGSVGVTLYSTNGTEMMKVSAAIDPFKPAQVNVGELPGGSYTVEVNYQGGKYRNNIVKL